MECAAGRAEGGAKKSWKEGREHVRRDSDGTGRGVTGGRKGATGGGKHEGEVEKDAAAKDA
jgi:hypothetical protein